MADALSPAPSAGAVAFLGNEAAYWRLRIKGAGLLILTLGLYRFWFATDVRRFLWSNTEIGGETLEYTGLATELLGGFLLALAILVPLYTAFAIAALELSPRAPISVAVGLMLLALAAEALAEHDLDTPRAALAVGAGRARPPERQSFARRPPRFGRRLW